MSTYYDFLPDNQQRFSDGAAALTADGIAQVSSADAILDFGDARVPPSSRAKVDISACDDADGDETYEIQVRGSASSDLSSAVVLAALPVDRGTTGSTELPFTNVKFGTTYQYVGLYLDVGGTSPSMTFKSWYAHDRMVA